MSAACPRCGSTDPAVRLSVAYRVFICNDPWHDRPTGVTVSDPCPKCGVPAPGHCDCDRPTEADDLAARLQGAEADYAAAAARIRELEAENADLRRKLNAVRDWTEATSEDEDDSDWPLTTHEPYAAARNRVRSIIEEEQ